MSKFLAMVFTTRRTSSYNIWDKYELTDKTRYTEQDLLAYL